MRKIASLIAVMLLAGCGASEEKAAPVAAVDTPEQVVRKLYESPKPPADKPTVLALFTPEFAPSMAPDSGPPGITYDYRYDVQVEPKVTDLAYAAEQKGPKAARVVVSFKQDGTADSMVYELCMRPDGQWRIRNIIDPDAGSGTLRYNYGLSVVRAGQCPMPEA